MKHLVPTIVLAAAIVGCGDNVPADTDRADQTISFTSTPPSDATIGATYTVRAAASSGLPVAFTIDASARTVCSVAGQTVSFTGKGDCIVNADQPGDDRFNAAPRVQQTFSVGKTPQTITFTSTAPSNAIVDGLTYTVTATATSGLPVTLSIDPSAVTACTLAGATVTFTGAGTCIVDADQEGDGTFQPAARVQQSIAVGKGMQTIAFTSTAPDAAVVAGATYDVAAISSAGLPVALTVDASAISVCTLVGSTVWFIGAGTCVIDADQVGDDNYNAAPQAQQSFVVGKGSQTISFTSTAPAAASVSGGTYEVSATSTAMLPVTLTVDASSSTVCSISGSTVSFVGAGTCVIDANQAGDTNYNAAAQVQQSFVVAKGAQTIAFTTTPPANALVGGSYNVAAAATSGLSVTVSIDAAASGVCSLSGSNVSFIGDGTCIIDASQAGNANYEAAASVQQSFVVSKIAQTISFTSTPPANAAVEGSYVVSATATSGLPVSLSLDASASAVCTLAGSTISFIGAGTCVVYANQAGNVTYSAAAQVQQSFPIAKGAQTISFTTTPPATPLVGGTYAVAATASSGLPVTITSAASSVCTIAGGTVTFVGAGTCVIDADQPGNGNYNAAPQVQQTLSVSKAEQTITFTSTAPANALVGGTYAVAATATSGLPVTLTSGAASVCTIAGSTVSFIGAGTCVINANQAGDTVYDAAALVQQTFSVSKSAQTIAFTSVAPASAVVAGATYSVSATATSGLPVSLSIDASAVSVCTMIGTTVWFIASGTCVINGNQAGNATYDAAPQAQQSFGVGKGTQTISFTTTPPASALVGGTYSVAATTNAGLPVTFTSAATGVCTVAGSTVSFIAAGTCVINADQAGNANYNAATPAQQSFSVTKTAQTISFTSTPPANALVGDTYTVTATATSGLPVAITSATTSVCTVAGSTVAFVGAGTCVIDADQAGNAMYDAATQVQQSFGVTKNAQTISFTTTPPVSPVVGGVTYAVAATATSGLPVSITSASTSVCTLAGSTVSFIGAGTCVIDANQAGNATYSAAPPVQQSFTVTRQVQTISFTSTAPTAASVGGSNYTVSAAATSGLSVALTIDASASAVCTIAGSTVSFVGSGTCVINANQAGDTTYDAALQVQQSFTVAKGTQTIAFTSTAPTSAAYQGTYAVSATATSGLVVSFSIEGSSSSVCAVSGSTVTFTGTGTCIVNADQVGNAGYEAATQVQQTFMVGPKLVADTYNVVGNTQLVAAGHSVPTTPFTSSPSAIIGNDLPNAAVSVTAVTNAATTGGGTISIDAAGRFIYTPPVGMSSGTDTYVYTGTSNGVSRTATLTFNIANIVWYVDSASTGAHDGRSNAPFGNLTSLSGLAGTNAYIHVATGGPTTTGAYSLLAGQHLIGAGATLTVGDLTIAGSSANTPVLSGTLSASNVSGVIVTGVRMSTGASTAVNLVNTDGTFTFQRIDTNGAPNGIVWNNTVAALPTSSFTVTGDDSNTALGGNGTGGVISNTRGADGAIAGTGVYLNNVGNVTLRRMVLNGTLQNYAIRGYRVSGFTLEYSTLAGSIGTAATLAFPENAGEGTIYFGNTTTNGLTSSGTFTSNFISGGRGRNVSIMNVSGTATLTFKNNSFGLNQNFVDAGQSLAVETRTGATANVVLDTNTFTGSPGDLINMTGQTGTTMDVQMKNNALSNAHANNNIGGGGVTLATQGTMTFNVDNNTMRGASGSAITLQKASEGALLSGRITNNQIGAAGIVGSGSKSGNGIFLSAAGAGTVALTILNNQIRNWANAGMYFDNTGGSYTANFTIQGNTVAEPGPAAFSTLVMTNGSFSSPDTVNVCAAIGSPNPALKNAFTGSAGSADVYLGASGAAGGHVFNLPGYVGTTLAAVETFMSNNNMISGGASYIIFNEPPTMPTMFTGNGVSCPTP